MKACSFELQIVKPDETIQRLGKFFQDRKLLVETLTLHRYRDGKATVYFKCEIGADQIARVTYTLKDIEGILEITKMVEK